jgi:transposase-like protein
METDLARAQHYRDMAQQMRALIDQETNAESRKALIALADNYDRLYQACLGRADQRPH